MIDTIDNGSRLLKEPVISIIKIIPVIGALTIAVKYPAIDNMIKLVKLVSFIPKEFMHIYPKIEPIEPPIISRGKNIPPGAPEPKLIIENNNLPIKTKNKSNNVLLSENSSRAAWPPQSNTGNINPNIPAKANGINNLVEVDTLSLPYSF